MRLDKFLKVSRIIKRRTVANEACGNHRVLLNGKEAKSSKIVKPEDIIEVYFGDKVYKFRILALPTGNVGKTDAMNLYEIIGESHND